MLLEQLPRFDACIDAMIAGSPRGGADLLVPILLFFVSILF